MSLIKSFNTSYLKENLKKSKGIIALLVILVPLFTALNTIVNINGTEEYVNIPAKEWISGVNIYGMYIIPVALSFLLFGYVYKKNSVDLINSMPINRKSIFVTNTVIGIVLITIIQILTAVALFVCNQFLENIYIYTGIIIDLFILMWVAYVFVFTATNLAMTFSGTFPTQVLLTVLILMLVPFLLDSYNNFFASKEFEFVVGNDTFTSFVQYEEEFTLPYKNLKYNSYFAYDYEYVYEMYNTASIIRMASLSIIYLVMGSYFFSRRKMENCEEAFAKVSTHIFVKALTILPIMMLLTTSEVNGRLALNLCLIVFYYYIYDFIVRRKVGVKTSILGLVLTIGILYGSCMGINYIKENREMPKIRMEDVSEIAIESENYYDRYRKFNILDIASDANHFIKNTELIKTVFEAAADINNQEKLYTEELERYNNNEIDIMSNFVDATRGIDVVLKMDNGKIYKLYLNISEFNYDNVIRILENDDEYKSKLLAELEMNDKIMLDGKILNDEVKNKIKNEIKSKINSINKEDMFFDGNLGYVAKYYYDDHRLMYTDLCIEITPEMLNICADEYNKIAIQKMEKAKENNQLRSFDIDLSDEPMWWGLSNKYFSFLRTREQVADLVMQENDFSAKENFYKITGNIEDGGQISFFTNNVDEVDRLIQLEVERNNEYYWEYQYDLEKYYRSSWLYENHYFEESGEEIYQDDTTYEYEEEFYEEETNTVENETVEGNYIEDIYIDNTVEGNVIEIEPTIIEGNYVEEEIYIEENYVENTVVNEIYTNEVVYENIV